MSPEQGQEQMSRDKLFCPGTSPTQNQEKDFLKQKKGGLKQENDVLKQENDVLKQERKFCPTGSSGMGQDRLSRSRPVLSRGKILSLSRCPEKLHCPVPLETLI